LQEVSPFRGEPWRDHHSIPSGTNEAFLERHRFLYRAIKGYEALLNYGESLGKIEIAVKEKGASTFLLAIETDGALFQKRPHRPRPR
jgi:hypothetical protein